MILNFTFHIFHWNGHIGDRRVDVVNMNPEQCLPNFFVGGMLLVLTAPQIKNKVFFFSSSSSPPHPLHGFGTSTSDVKKQRVYCVQGMFATI
jgi:hypothetical protein